MKNQSSTLKEGPVTKQDGEVAHCPGLALLFSCGKPAALPISLQDGEVELGRGAFGTDADPRMSRQHARVRFDGTRFLVTDLGSQNGTICDGRPIAPQCPTEVQRLIKVGDSLFCCMRDITPLSQFGVKAQHGRVMGPTLQVLLNEVQQVASYSDALHITGESGTGKEFVAQAFHEAGLFQKGRFVPVNCAAIPQGLAERLLFGARRGAFSGADEDAEGYIHAATRGTLFLDELGELDINVQAKLLRVLETKELLPLGSSRSSSVEVQICSATNKDLRVLVARGRFREDLYYRIGRPMVSILPLRKRAEEIPWLMHLALQKITFAPPMHSSLVEACLLRPWPGNIRELIIELRGAAQTAAAQRAARVEARHLATGAGMVLCDVSETSTTSPSGTTPPPTPVRTLDPAERARLVGALRAHDGNVSGAARALSLHRTQMRRLLDRHGIDPRRFASTQSAGLDPEDI